MQKSITVTDEEGYEHELPTRWEICNTCRGEGHHSRAIGAITQSEWEYEWSPDEQEAYLRGEYDKVCEECGGSGKVLVVDEESADPALLKLYHQQLREEAYDRHLQRMESGYYGDDY